MTIRLWSATIWNSIITRQPRPWLVWPERWLSCYRWMSGPSPSHIIPFQLEAELTRGVWDALKEDNWTLLGNKWGQCCFEAQESAVALFQD